MIDQQCYLRSMQRTQGLEKTAPQLQACLCEMLKNLTCSLLMAMSKGQVERTGDKDLIVGYNNLRPKRNHTSDWIFSQEKTWTKSEI